MLWLHLLQIPTSHFTYAPAIPQGKASSAEMSYSFVFLALPCYFVSWEFPFPVLPLVCLVNLWFSFRTRFRLDLSCPLPKRKLIPLPLHFLHSFNMLLCFTYLLHCDLFPFMYASHLQLDCGFFVSRTVLFTVVPLMSDTIPSFKFIYLFFILLFIFIFIVINYLVSINTFACLTMP